MMKITGPLHQHIKKLVDQVDTLTSENNDLSTQLNQKTIECEELSAITRDQTALIQKLKADLKRYKYTLLDHRPPSFGGGDIKKLG